MDNKRIREQVGIARNDEPTRFLSKEEMEQLENAINQQESRNNVKVEPVKAKSSESKIKIEDITETIDPKKNGNSRINDFTGTVSNIIKKIFFAIIIIVVAVIGFSLAFAWYSPVDKDYESSRNVEVAETKTSTINEHKEVKDINKNDDDFYNVSEKIDHAKKLVGNINEDIDDLNSLKSKVKEVEQVTEQISLENISDIDDLKYQVENFINKFLN